MAYRRGENEQDLEQQLLGQMEPPTFGGGAERIRTMPEPYPPDGGLNRTYAMGGAEALPGVGGVSRDSTLREDRSNSQLAGKAEDVNRVPVTGAMPAPTASTTGPEGLSRGGLADAVKRARANNFSDIEGAESIQAGDFVGNLEGFNVNGWGSGERGSNTMKNTFGRIASRYDPRQAGAAKSLLNDQDFRAAWPDAVLVDHPNGDLIDFDGPGGDPPVDVLRAARAGGAGEAWQWGVQGGGGGGQQGVAGDRLLQNLDVNSLLGGDPMAAINEQIAGLTGGQDSQIQQLIQQILSGQSPQV